MIDCDGNILEIGQTAITEPESEYFSHTVKVVGFTKKMVKISIKSKNGEDTITVIKPTKLRIKR